MFVSFINASLIKEAFDDVNSVLTFTVVYAVLCAIWITKNSFVFISNNMLIFRGIGGKKQKITLEGINSLKLLDCHQARTMLSSRSSINPLIANCFVFSFHIGKFVTFKNEYNRDVLIGVWNYNRLYSLLSERNATKALETLTDLKSDEKGAAVNNSVDSSKIHCIASMSIRSHLITYFKHFSETILLPLIYVCFIRFLFKGIKIDINTIASIALFAVASVIEYYKIISVYIQPSSKTIKLNMFYNSDKRVISYSKIHNLRFAKATDDINELMSIDPKKKISTPYRKN